MSRNKERLSREKQNMSGHYLFLALVLPFVILVDTSSYSKPPQIINKLSNEVLLKFGPIHRFTLSCNADGDPLPSTQWYKNSQPLAKDSSA